MPPPAPGPAAPASAATPGSLIGVTVSHYRILERLGGGGMGVVYKAWDLRLERQAALKFLSPQRSSSDDFKRRFAREARTASRLEHPNICTVFESDETADGRLFIAMAFCEGESLKRKIERGPLPLADALSIAVQVAAGLDAAHAKGIVHRDVKPGNIMVAPDGRVKIVDFGIARLADQTRLTKTGDVMGTTPYVAPEQFLEEEADQRADLWSLGVVLYEMVAGRLPWSAADDRELVKAIVNRPPRPLTSMRGDAPPALERVVARALAKRRDERYARAAELRADLDEIAALLAPPAASLPYEQTLIEAPHLAASGERGATPPASVAPPLAGAPALGGTAADAGGALPASASGGIASWNPLGADRRPVTGQTGRIVGHYRILAMLGGGGMGVVYKAQDLTLERIVALKFLPPELTRDPEAKTRFLQEARAASALDHPNICTIHEVGETDDGQLYLAMACYDGETLKQRLGRGRLPIDEALETAQQVARGLVKAHRHGIVHRDIKPANVMVTTDDIVKILDFGIAKLLGAAGLTRVGSSLGTPGYMSPEQARGEEVDPRTDVWSLGAVLYEMVTGRRPFRGEHEQAVLYSLFNEEPEPVLQLRPDAPPELARIVGRMLAKDPDQRYPTAAAALSDLRALYGPVTGTFTGTTSVPALAAAPVSSSRRRTWRRWVPLAAAAVVVLATAAFLLRRQLFQPAAVPPSYKRLTSFDGKATYPSMSPEGKFFVYARAVGGRSHIFWQRVDGENPTDLSKDSPADDTQPALSPDGQQVAFRSERDGGGIFIMGSTGEARRRLTNFGFNPSWSPTGLDLVVATEGISDPAVRVDISQLWRVNVATGAAQRLATADAVQPSWSPGGERIAFWAREPVGGNRGIWTIPASGGPPVLVLQDHNLNWDPVWSPDGAYLYFASNRNGPMNFWRVPIDEASGRPSGPPEPHTTPSQSSAYLTFSHDGSRFAYASDDNKSIIEKVGFDPHTGATVGEPATVVGDARMIQSVEPSPDGRWLVYDTVTPNEQIYLVRPDRSDARRLTTDSHKYRMARWTPDSSAVMFYSDRDKRWRAWSLRIDGSGLERIADTPDVFDLVSSPDGKKLACDIGTNGTFSLIDLALPPASRRPVPLLPANRPFAPFSWSPDGQRVVGMTDLSHGIFIYSFVTHALSALVEAGAGIPSWMHDNRNILYVRDGKVDMIDSLTRVSRTVLAPPPDSSFTGASAGPDDRVLYLLRTVAAGDIWLGENR